MIVVADSSCLIALSSIGRLELLREFYKKIYIPEAVYEEVVIQGSNRTGAEEVKKASSRWIKRTSIVNVGEVEALQFSLDIGEAETIVLAREISADLIILDNSEPRNTAKFFGFKVIGTLGILKEASKRGIIEDLRKVLNDLKNKGFWVSDRVYKRILGERHSLSFEVDE